jgi:hypothetical protein
MTLEFDNTGGSNAAEIVLTNLNGAVLNRMEAKLINGMNKLSYDASAVANGYYTLSITTSQGTTSKTVHIKH